MKFRTLRAIGSLVLVAAVGFVIVSCDGNDEPFNAPALKAPQVDNCPNLHCRKWYEVVKDATKVDSTDLGWVIIKRQDDGALFSALVTPYQDIRAGTKVWVRELIYRQNNMALATFLLAYQPGSVTFEFRPYAPQDRP